MSDPGYVSVCPFCIHYHNCASEPLQVPLDQSVPERIRFDEYKALVNNCELYDAFDSKKR